MNEENVIQNGFNMLEGLKSFCHDVLFHNIPRIIIALLILWIGWKLIKVFTNFLQKVFAKKNFDISLQSLLELHLKYC